MANGQILNIWRMIDFSKIEENKLSKIMDDDLIDEDVVVSKSETSTARREKVKAVASNTKRKTNVSINIKNTLKKLKWTSFDGNVFEKHIADRKSLEVYIQRPRALKELLQFISGVGKAFNVTTEVLFSFKDCGTDIMFTMAHAGRCTMEFLVNDTIRAHYEDKKTEKYQSVYQIPIEPLIGILDRFGTRHVGVTIHDREVLSITSEIKDITKVGTKKKVEETNEEEEEDTNECTIDVNELLRTKGYDASSVRLPIPTLDIDENLDLYQKINEYSKQNGYDYCILIPGGSLKSIMQQNNADDVAMEHVQFSFSMPDRHYIESRSKLFFSIECGSNISRIEVVSQTIDQFMNHHCFAAARDYFPDDFFFDKSKSFYFANLMDNVTTEVDMRDRLMQKVYDAEKKGDTEVIKNINKRFQGAYSYQICNVRLPYKTMQNVIKDVNNQYMLMFNLNTDKWPHNKDELKLLIKENDQGQVTLDIPEPDTRVRLLFDFDNENHQGPYSNISIMGEVDAK